jgi:hypothetical protein
MVTPSLNNTMNGVLYRFFYGILCMVDNMLSAADYIYLCIYYLIGLYYPGKLSQWDNLILVVTKRSHKWSQCVT